MASVVLAYAVQLISKVDEKRRNQSQVPENWVFLTKPQLVERMLEHIFVEIDKLLDELDKKPCNFAEFEQMLMGFVNRNASTMMTFVRSHEGFSPSDKNMQVLLREDASPRHEQGKRRDVMESV